MLETSTPKSDQQKSQNPENIPENTVEDLKKEIQKLQQENDKFMNIALKHTTSIIEDSNEIKTLKEQI